MTCVVGRRLGVFPQVSDSLPCWSVRWLAVCAEPLARILRRVNCSAKAFRLRARFVRGRRSTVRLMCRATMRGLVGRPWLRRLTMITCGQVSDVTARPSEPERVAVFAGPGGG
jgi:hypothetical protein